MSRSLEGLLRHASTHAAGVVISDAPLVNYLPLYRGQKGEVITQFAMNDVGKIGLIKFDFLGLKTLTVIQETLKLIKSKQSDKLLDINNLPLNDKNTYDLLCSGETDGIFQLESSGKDLIKRLRPENFEDIITIAMAPNATYEYKFNIGLGWDGKDETGSNRSVVVGATGLTVPVSFFNDYNPVTGVTSAVTFSVDMQLPAQGDFDPATDNVYIAGNFTNWATGALVLEDPDNDSIYTVTVSDFTSGELAIYKFVWSPTTAANGNWESPKEGDDIFPPDNNRIYGVHDGDNTVSRWWNNVNPNVQLADGNIFFEVDMSVPAELDVFDPNVDSVQIRGSFNGWKASIPDISLMNQNPADPDDWFLEIPFELQILNSNQKHTQAALRLRPALAAGRWIT